MVVVAMVAVIVVVVFVVKVLVWAAWIFDMVVVVEVFFIDVLADVEILVVGVIVIVLKFAFTVSCSLDVSSGMTIDSFMEALAGAMLGVLSGIGVEELADVNTNVFAFRMAALEFPVSTPLKEFSRPLALLGCATPFDCRTLALLDCTRVLQARMPSYHV